MPSRYLRDIPSVHVIKSQFHGFADEHGGHAAAGPGGCAVQINQDEPADSEFAKSLDGAHRATVSMLFGKWCQMAAFGAGHESRLISKVKGVANERLAKKGEKSKDALRALLELLKAKPEQALEYARVHVAYSQLPGDIKFERQQAKQDQFAKAAMNAKMEGRPASEKQRSFLRSLGCSAVPKDALEASNMIEHFKKT